MEIKETASVKDLITHTQDYVKTKVDIIAYTAADKASGMVSNAVVYLAIFIMAGFFMFFVSVGIALGMAETLGGLHFSFFFVSAFYLIAGILLWVMRDKWIKTPLADQIIKELFKEKNL